MSQKSDRTFIIFIVLFFVVQSLRATVFYFISHKAYQPSQLVFVLDRIVIDRNILPIMEKAGVPMSDEEIVSRILGLPLERIDYLKQNHGLVCEEAGFEKWFVENAALVLAEKKRQFNEEMGVPQEAIPTSSDRADAVPVSYGS